MPSALSELLHRLCPGADTVDLLREATALALHPPPESVVKAWLKFDFAPFRRAPLRDVVAELVKHSKPFSPPPPGEHRRLVFSHRAITMDDVRRILPVGANLVSASAHPAAVRPLHATRVAWTGAKIILCP